MGAPRPAAGAATCPWERAHPALDAVKDTKDTGRVARGAVVDTYRRVVETCAPKGERVA